AIANVKISSDDNRVGNAIERFMGRGRREILRVAQETLEGHVRGVLAAMTPEEVNENRLKFAESLQEVTTDDFEKLGLHLDTLKIQNVSDERDYLDSIGRKSIAEIIKVAEVAESDAMKAAEEAEARAQGEGEVARRQAQAQIQKAQNELQQLKADLEKEAKSEEERTEARTLAARAEAEQELQQVRTELEKLRLQADVVIPAEAEKVARELEAAGEAAEIAEKGRAMAEILRMMTEVWKEAGDDAMDVFIIHRLESIMEQVSEAARQVAVREVALIDSGDGKTLPNYVSSFPSIVGNIFQEMRQTVGLDIGGALTGEKGANTPSEPVRKSIEEAVKKGIEDRRERGELEGLAGGGNKGQESD
ncbi:MAG: flotillin family protein, partial [Persicimonas sp.]